MSLSRRQFLELLPAGAVVLRSTRVGAMGAKPTVQLAQLQLGKAWNPHPNALQRLSRQIQTRTSIDINPTPKVVRLSDKNLHETPILYLAGNREFPIPRVHEIVRLRRFLTFGGFLIIDSAEGRSDGAFDAAVRELLKTLYPPPSNDLQNIPRAHVIYKSFYLLDRPSGRLALSSVFEGVTHDDRLTVAYIKNDMGGAWSQDDFGNWEFSCQPGGEKQREYSFRTGINLVMYALCLDYKSDQVHADFILRKRKWRTNDGAEIPK